MCFFHFLYDFFGGQTSKKWKFWMEVSKFREYSIKFIEVSIFYKYERNK
jgi:hypothetical protein